MPTSSSRGRRKPEYNQYFSQTEPVTVKLDGKVYHIDPPRRRAGALNLIAGGPEAA